MHTTAASISHLAQLHALAVGEEPEHERGGAERPPQDERRPRAAQEAEERQALTGARAS